LVIPFHLKALTKKTATIIAPSAPKYSDLGGCTPCTVGRTMTANPTTADTVAATLRARVVVGPYLALRATFTMVPLLNPLPG
jgi:hypothetical protein